MGMTTQKLTGKFSSTFASYVRLLKVAVLSVKGKVLFTLQASDDLEGPEAPPMCRSPFQLLTKKNFIL